MASVRSVKKRVSPALFLGAWFAIRGFGLSFAVGPQSQPSTGDGLSKEAKPGGMPSMAGDFVQKAKEMAATDDFVGSTPRSIDCVASPPSPAQMAASILRESGDAGVWIWRAGTFVLNHLQVIRDEVDKSENLTRAQRLVDGLTFDCFQERASSLIVEGIPVIDPDLPKEDPEAYPYKKIVEDLCKGYKLDIATKMKMLNGKLAKKNTATEFDIHIRTGEPGHFYFAQFLAHNNNGKIDVCFLIYKLYFKIKPDVVTHTNKKKFLWWVTGEYKTYEEKEVAISHQEIKDFDTYFRWRLLDKLGPELKAKEVKSLES